MQSGLINKVAVTPANLTDSSGFKHVCPSSGAAYADKGYCVGAAPRIAQGISKPACSNSFLGEKQPRLIGG